MIATGVDTWPQAFAFVGGLAAVVCLILGVIYLVVKNGEKPE